MKKRDEFSFYHPIVNLLYFVLVLGFSMFGMHPVCLLLSCLCAFAYYAMLKDGAAVKNTVKFALPILAMTVIVNPAFSHNGNTVLCRLPSGSPLTLESIYYGFAAGLMLLAVLIWFACFSEVMTTEKLLWLFGRLIPSISLVLSMTLRFVPLFRQRFEKVRETQAALGRDVTNGPLLKRMKNAVTCFSIVVTWSLENAVRTADSMKSRGYGTGKRSFCSVYRWEERDVAALLLLSVCGFYLLCGTVAGGLRWDYFPDFTGCLAQPFTLSLYAAYFILCIFPVYTGIKEANAWKRSALTN